MKTIFALSLAALSLFAFALPARAQSASHRVRVVLALDTHGDNLGTAPSHYGNSLANTLKEGFRGRESQLVIDRVFTGATVTPANIINHYRRSPAAANETLVFYYFGHGAVDTRSGKPFFAMKYGELFRSQLRSEMLSKSPRLCVILTECCSSYIPSRQQAPSSSNYNIAPVSPNYATLSHLLIYSSGVVDISAASPGQIALGGLLTSAFTQYSCERPERMDSNGDRFLAWSEFFSYIRAKTDKDFQLAKLTSISQVRRQVNQTPYWYSHTVRRQTTRPKYLVSVVKNPYDMVVVYQIRWSTESNWTTIQIQPRAGLAHSIEPRGGSPKLYVRFDATIGDKAIVPREYELKTQASNVNNDGMRYSFGSPSQGVINLYTSQ